MIQIRIFQFDQIFMNLTAITDFWEARSGNLSKSAWLWQIIATEVESVVGQSKNGMIFSSWFLRIYWDMIHLFFKKSTGQEVHN
jgi:hypothetical protein